MTKSTSEQHQESQNVSNEDPCRGTDGARSVNPDPPPSDPGPPRGGHHGHGKPEHPGKES